MGRWAANLAPRHVALILPYSYVTSQPANPCRAGGGEATRDLLWQSCHVTVIESRHHPDSGPFTLHRQSSLPVNIQDKDTNTTRKGRASSRYRSNNIGTRRTTSLLSQEFVPFVLPLQNGPVCLGGCALICAAASVWLGRRGTTRKCGLMAPSDERPAPRLVQRLAHGSMAHGSMAHGLGSECQLLLLSLLPPSRAPDED